MSVAVPSHTIRTIHGSFGSPSFSSVASGISQAQASSFASLPNITYQASHARSQQHGQQSRADTLAILSQRTPSASIHRPYSHYNNYSYNNNSNNGYGNSNHHGHTGSSSRARSSSMVAISSPVVTRRPPPPPPQVIQITEVEDPFLDTTPKLVVSLPSTRRSTRYTTTTTTQSSETRTSGNDSSSSSEFVAPTPIVPSQRPAVDRRAAKFVASVLLSRGCGRPMRRRPASGEPKTYVKSCLSRMVEVDC